MLLMVVPLSNEENDMKIMESSCLPVGFFEIKSENCDKNIHHDDCDCVKEHKHEDHTCDRILFVEIVEFELCEHCFDEEEKT